MSVTVARLARLIGWQRPMLALAYTITKPPTGPHLGFEKIEIHFLNQPAAVAGIVASDICQIEVHAAGLQLQLS